MRRRFSILLLFLLLKTLSVAQHSVAREWNEQVLNAIRNDFARPTIHARNLFHTSAAMYDAWAIFEPNAAPYFFGKKVNGYPISFHLDKNPSQIKALQEKAMSYAVYRLIKYRFQNAPNAQRIFQSCDNLMFKLGFDINNTSTNYFCGAAELGNYLAQKIIEYGLKDGSNEINDYQNLFYQPINEPLEMESPGNPNISDLNHWQPLEFNIFIDQSGNPLVNPKPDFQSPEWGIVHPFSLQKEDAQYYQRDNFEYVVYHDPGKPIFIEDSAPTDLENYYKWAHTLVSVWSSHLDSEDTTLIDISPSSIGNIVNYPSDISKYDEFYNFFEGGDNSPGHTINPKTGLAYKANIVKRSDYTRVLAEFWADGPNSETPPGHWFTILNTVNDNPFLEKKFMGKGPILTNLEWDVKSYFMLGGAMHDVAISTWGIKGWYDYIRPISAIRGMAEFGQGSDPDLPNYHKFGLPLIPGFVELISAGDSLAGENGEFLNKLKVYAWRGPNYITNPEKDLAGVGWIRAGEWWPFQRPTFVTPPFAGYVSGHSTFSRAAAEILTAMTGDPFFPGGIGGFYCPKNEFLVFEEGPSTDVTLQWATYQDAADQCGLSRIWGGIHPPVDDIPGRIIGIKIGQDAFNYALQYFENEVPDTDFESVKVFPNPSHCGIFIEFPYTDILQVQIFKLDGKLVSKKEFNFDQEKTYLDLSELENGFYIIALKDQNNETLFRTKLLKE